VGCFALRFSEGFSMYSVVLLVAATSGGDVSGFGHKNNGCNGCTGYTVGCSGYYTTGCTGYTTGCNGCQGTKSGFLGLCHKKNNCTGCTGYVYPTGCTGYTPVAPAAPVTMPAPPVTGCTGYVYPTGCTGYTTGCHGSTNCNGGGFLGLRHHKSKSCNGGCYGY
jgi:hypothetical protein